MPVVVAGAAISGAIAASTALPWLAAGAFVKAFATSLILGGLSHALSPKPKKQQAAADPVQSNTISIRQPDEPRKHIYGMTRVADVFAHMTTTGTNEKLHAFVVLSASELTSINEVWVGDYVIPDDHMDSEGNVIAGRYSGKLRIRKHLGSPNQVADPVAVAEIPEWTVNHRGRGVGYMYVTLTKDNDVYPTGFPNFSAVCRGRALLDPRIGASLFTMNNALMYHDYLRYANFGFKAIAASVDETENIPAEANIGDEIVATVAVDQTATLIDTATDIITLSGDRVLFENGDQVEVVSTGAIPGGLAAATDYYVYVYQTKDTARIKLCSSLANAMAGTTIDITSAGSGIITIRKTGEPRYHGAGIVNTADEMGDIISTILASMAGRAVNSGGKWRLYSGAWREPTVTLNRSKMRTFNFRRPVEMSEKFNVIKGKFISPLNNYQSTDYPVTRYQAFIDQDGGIEYPPRDLALGFTTRPTTAQRIAKIELFRSRQDIVINSGFGMEAFILQPCDTVSLVFPEMGWEPKIFEVTQFQLTFGGVDNPALTTLFSLRETAEAIYNWTSDEGIEIDPAPNSSLPNPFVVTVPTGVAFFSRSAQTAADDTVYSLALMWDLHPDAFVIEGGYMEIQFKESSNTEYLPSFFVDGALTLSDVLTGSVNVQYDLRIRAVNKLGRRSGWVTILNATVGSSGGVGATEDWGSVADAPSVSEDWGSVVDGGSPLIMEDWESVA